MSGKKRLPRRFTLDAIDLINKADVSLLDQHQALLSAGFVLAPRARCYRRQDKRLTVQINWTRRERAISFSYTVTVRGL